MKKNWLKVESAAIYADVSSKTFRKWLLGGQLKHIRLPSGTILVKVSWVDEYLEGYIQEDAGSDIDKITDAVVAELNNQL